MESYSKDFSVIVPVWRGAIRYIPKLIESIPQREGIEIIVVDNSKEPVNRKEILSDREFVFLHSSYERHAGGSRNDGIAASHGKWLIFADADDYFTPGAFDIFYSKYDSDAELIFTKPDGIYEDTGEKSTRGDGYSNKVHAYCVGEVSDETLRYGFYTPWCKMVSHSLIDREGLRYDEIRAGNDIYFSLTSGYYAKKIDAIDVVTYVVTVNRGSLTRSRGYEITKARLYSKLHCNEFMRKHGLSKYQHSVMFALSESRRYGIGKTCEFLRMIIKFHQNPLIGCGRWLGSLKRNKKNNQEEAKYIIKS